MDKEPFDNHEELEESEETGSEQYSVEGEYTNETYSINNMIIALAVVALIYFLIKRPSRVVVQPQNPRGTLMTNLVLLATLAAIYYLYNKNKSDSDYTKNKDYKYKSSNTLIPRFTNTPEIDERFVKLKDDSLESYIDYFKKFNKPLAKGIKSGLRIFNDKSNMIMEQEVNTFLVQELDNLNFLKNSIIESAESLIYTIDVGNRKTEEIYNEFNQKLKYYLESSYNETKTHAKMKKSENIKNCVSDIDVYSGVLVSDQEVSPSNY